MHWAYKSKTQYPLTKMSPPKLVLNFGSQTKNGKTTRIFQSKYMHMSTKRERCKVIIGKKKLLSGSSDKGKRSRARNKGVHKASIKVENGKDLDQKPDMFAELDFM